MHLKIIFIGMEDKIVFDKGILEEVNGEYKKIYYKINNDTIEALFFNEQYSRISNFISRGSVVVINEDNKLTAEELESIKNNEDIVLVSGKRNNNIINFKKEFIFPCLSKNEKVKIYDIILTIYNIFDYDSLISNISAVSGVIGFSSIGNWQQNILVDVLNNFKIIEKSEECNLNLYLQDELNVAELAYLEDPIKEYTYKNSNLKIKQNINKNYNDNIYFSVIGI